MVPKTYSIPLWWNEVEKRMLTPRKLIIKIFYLKDIFKTITMFLMKWSYEMASEKNFSSYNFNRTS